MNKLYANFYFFIIVIWGFLLVGLFNFLVDPYNIFKNAKVNSIKINFPYESYPVLKFKKKHNIETFLLGGSQVNKMLPSDFLNDKYLKIGIEGNSYQVTYEILYAYLDMHPETKKVILFFAYEPFLNNYISTAGEYKSSNFTFREIITMFFSRYTTQRSFYKIKNRLKKQNNHIESSINKFSYPYRYPNISSEQKLLDDMYRYNINYIEKIVELLKQKNITYYIIIPPYNACFLSLIKKNEKIKQLIQNLKKDIVSFDVDLYDMAFINKYTSVDIFSKDNYFFIDYAHFNVILGVKVLEDFLIEEKKYENELYFYLNPKNIEDKLKLEEQLIEEYILKNEKSIEHYLENLSDFFSPIFNKQIEINVKDIPQSHFDEMERVKELAREI